MFNLDILISFVSMTWFIEHNLAWISSAVYVTSTLWSEQFINEQSKGLRVKGQGMNPQPVMDRRWTPIFRRLAITVPIGAGSLREEPPNHVWNSKERRAGSPWPVWEEDAPAQEAVWFLPRGSLYPVYQLLVDFTASKPNWKKEKLGQRRYGHLRWCEVWWSDITEGEKLVYCIQS